AAEALSLTEARTGLAKRTNRPCVYVVAGLAGGTGGGMFLDMAYALRGRLKRMGYEFPQVVGIFVVPPADPALASPPAPGNASPALTELNHYARPETASSAHYDDRGGSVREQDPPFSRCYLVPGTAAELNLPGGSGSSGTPRTPAPASGVVP